MGYWWSDIVNSLTEEELIKYLETYIMYFFEDEEEATKYRGNIEFFTKVFEEYYNRKKDERLLPYLIMWKLIEEE